MADEKGTKAGTKSKAEDAQTDTAETNEATIEINSADDIASLVNELRVSGVTGPTARQYTKKGFKGIDPLLTTDPKVLAVMSGCISFALSEQVQSGTEGAKDALKHSIDFAKNAVALSSHMSKLRSFTIVALEVGYGDGADIDQLDTAQMASIVTEFLSKQTNAKVEKPFQEWLKTHAAV